jgi:NAD(P)-dependent dehydrogenase (short-subunit alcohol dehydrogenase family)
MSFGLDGLTAVVTGAGSGLGRAAAATLLADGARVVAADLEVAAIEPADRLVAVQADVRDPSSTDALAAAALDRFGQIDVLVNCAGVMTLREEGFLSVTDDQWSTVWDTNFLGYVRTARSVLPHMVERGTGSLVHIASIRGTHPAPNQPDYSVSKASVLTLSQCLAREFGPLGIRSNVVSPGPVRTPAWDKPGGIGEQIAARHGMPLEDAIDHEFRAVRKIPLGRAGTAGEIAGVIAFLAGPLAANVTGANVVVDGGSTVPA